jgi:hypothetical protein
MGPGISAWEDQKSWKQRKWVEILSCARTVHSTANHYHEPNKQARDLLRSRMNVIIRGYNVLEIVDRRILASRGLRAVVWTKEASWFLPRRISEVLDRIWTSMPSARRAEKHGVDLDPSVYSW